MEIDASASVIALVTSVVALVISTLFAVRQLRSAKTANNTTVAVELLSRELLSAWFQESEAYIVERLAGEHESSGGIEGLPLDARAHVYRVGWFYASLAHLVAFGAINERMVISIVKFRLNQVWRVLAPYVRAERALRNPSSMIFFEDLACRAEDFDDAELQHKLRLRRFDDVDVPPTRAEKHAPVDVGRQPDGCRAAEQSASFKDCD